MIAFFLAPTAPEARVKREVPLTPDQQLVVAAAVNDAFPPPRHRSPPAVLCLDVQLVDEAPDEPPPPARARPGHARKPARAPEPPLPIIRGAPPELVERLARPWRTVASALACRLDPREPFTLNDAAQTPAQLVTVHLHPLVATGGFRIDWTDGTTHDPEMVNSRDCTAANGPRGWAVRCGGTWKQ